MGLTSLGLTGPTWAGHPLPPTPALCTKTLMRSVRVVSSHHRTFSDRLEKQERCIFINSVNHTDGKLNCLLHQENAGRLIAELGCPPAVPPLIHAFPGLI